MYIYIYIHVYIYIHMCVYRERQREYIYTYVCKPWFSAFSSCSSGIVGQEAIKGVLWFGGLSFAFSSLFLRHRRPRSDQRWTLIWLTEPAFSSLLLRHRRPGSDQGLTLTQLTEPAFSSLLLRHRRPGNDQGLKVLCTPKWNDFEFPVIKTTKLVVETRSCTWAKRI